MIGVFLVSPRQCQTYDHIADLFVGAFVAAPFGGLLWALGAFVLRISISWVHAKVKGHRFDAFDRPRPLEPIDFVGRGSMDEEREAVNRVEASSIKGKFF